MKFSRFRLLNGLVVLLVLALVFANFGVGTVEAGRVQYKCGIDVEDGDTNCEPPVKVKDLKTGRPLVMLEKCGCYKIELTTKGVGGFWLDLGNSPSNNCYGGDGGDFSHDSELCFKKRRLLIYHNDYSYKKCRECSHPFVSINDFVNSSGKVTIQVYDGSVSIEGAGNNRVGIPASKEGCIFACGKGRKDNEHHGPNDSIYWLGLNRVVNGSRTGSGVYKAEIFFHSGGYGSCCCGCDC